MNKKLNNLKKTIVWQAKDYNTQILMNLYLKIETKNMVPMTLEGVINGL